MGTMYDRSHDGGQGQVGMTDIPLDGSPTHVTQYNPADNTRVSWDANGGLDSQANQHYTNQNVPKGHDGRHG